MVKMPYLRLEAEESGRQVKATMNAHWQVMPKRTMKPRRSVQSLELGKGQTQALKTWVQFRIEANIRYIGRHHDEQY